MIKTILVPATGGSADDAVFPTALAVARRFAAHLDFLHVRFDPADIIATEAAAAIGGSTISGDLIERWEREAAAHEEMARQRFLSLCEHEGITVADDVPPAQRPPQGVSAAWRREVGVESDWVAEYGRAADLVVVGRSEPDTLEAALLDTGRPLLVPATPDPATRSGDGTPLFDGTVAVAWKNTPEAARAVTAAMPFLAAAQQVVILTVDEGGGDAEDRDESAERLARSLRWHGLAATARRLHTDAAGGAAEALLAAASGGEIGAGLLVMGGYGHGRLRELVFGGVTAHVLRNAAPIPVLLMH